MYQSFFGKVADKLSCLDVVSAQSVVISVKSINNLKSKTIDIASALNRMFDEVLHPQCTASFVEYVSLKFTSLFI